MVTKEWVKKTTTKKQSQTKTVQVAVFCPEANILTRNKSEQT